MSHWKDRLQTGFGLMTEGKHGEALALFDEGIELAAREGEEAWLVHYARNAAVVCEKLEDPLGTEKYCTIALKYAPADLGLLHFLGKAYQQLGNADLARRSFETAYRLAVDAQEMGLAETFKKELG
jgi:tetratricopeptide (TPR) repeat protein